jgi:hypothetical protein
VGEHGLDTFGSRLMGSSEHSNEPLSFIKADSFLTT